MPLTLPDLDDRHYADLVEEARGLLVTYAPSLTNHNPSDPLVTLTELFAHFTDILLFRLNLITDDQRRTFLRLLNGPDPEPPEPDSVPPVTPPDLEAAVRTTVLAVRSVDRAVTPADFELLALAADDLQRVVRAHCIPERNLAVNKDVERYAQLPGHVSVVIVLRDPHANPGTVVGVVADYLEPRRLLTTRVHVVGPRFVSIAIHVTLHLLPDALERDVRHRAFAALTNYLDPLAGGEGGGWPFGRAVHVSDLYRLLDGVAGVDFVSALPDQDAITTSTALADRLVRNDAREVIGVTLQPDELVELQMVEDDLDIELPASLT